MKVALAVAALAVAGASAPAGAVTEIRFTAFGLQTYSDRLQQGIPVPALASGSFVFDPTPGSSTYSYSGPISGVPYGTASASITDNRLTISFFLAINYKASVVDTLVADFRPGYLAGAFPSTIDFGQVTGSSFTERQSYTGLVDSKLDFTGPLTSLSAEVRAGPEPVLDMVSITPTPEPASWAMMIAGFGAIGYAMRRRRAGVRMLLAG